MWTFFFFFFILLIIQVLMWVKRSCFHSWPIFLKTSDWLLYGSSNIWWHEASCQIGLKTATHSESPWCLLPSHDLQFLLHNLEVFPDLIGYKILFSQLHRKVSRRHADQMQSLSKSDTWEGNLLQPCACQVSLLFNLIYLFILETHSHIHFPVVRSISGKVLWGHVLHCLFSTFSHPLCCDFLSVFSNGNLVWI